MLGQLLRGRTRHQALALLAAASYKNHHPSVWALDGIPLGPLLQAGEAMEVQQGAGFEALD